MIRLKFVMHKAIIPGNATFHWRTGDPLAIPGKLPRVVTKLQLSRSSLPPSNDKSRFENPNPRHDVQP